MFKAATSLTCDSDVIKMPISRLKCFKMNYDRWEKPPLNLIKPKNLGKKDINIIFQMNH